MNNKSVDLQERCYRFSKDIVNLIRSKKLDFVDSILAKQLIRSATSIGANIVEAQNSLSSKGFVNFYRITLNSSNESVYWLRLLNESNNDSKIPKLIDECQQLGKIIASIILKFK